jgi:uncharacterized repeat protein (TIGR02543 family)
MKKKIILLITFCVVFLTLIISISYAMFSAKVTYVNQETTVIKAAELNLIYTGIKEITAENIIPGDSFTKEFSVENKTGKTTNFNIYVENVKNEFNEDLVYSIIDEDGNILVNEKSLPETTEGKAYLLRNAEIADKAVVNYTIKIYYKYLEDVNQSENNGASFGGTIGIDVTALGHVVTLNADGGTLSTNEIYVVEKEPYGSLPTPQKTGYTFTGWYTSITEGEKIESDTIFNLKNDQTLYARYTANKYIISYNTNGGEAITDTKEVIYDGTYEELPTPINTGYKFAGWYLENNYKTKVTATDIVKITEDTILYAKWTADTYVVTLDPDGGSVSPNTIEVRFNNKYENLPEATKEGYTFNGWFNSDNIEINNVSIYEKTQDETLTAHWIANTYIVSFNANGGNINQSQKEVTYNQAYGNLPEVTREGYTFLGWYTKDTDGEKIESDTINNVSSNQTLYAHWAANTYTVSFDANGGSVEQTSKEITYASTYGKLPTPTYEGYEFVGWYDKLEGGTQITETSNVEITDNQTLYAVWSASDNTKYTVYHWQQNIDSDASNENEDNYTLIDTQLLYGTTNQNVTPDVNTYEGFKSPKSQTITIKNDGTTVINYYYTRNNYTLTVNKTDGVTSVTGAGSYAYNKDVMIEYSIKEGYTFESITGDKSSSAFKMPANDITVQINAKPNKYTITFNPTTNCTIDLTQKEVTYDSTYGNLPTPNCTGYKFDGWYTKEVGGDEVTSTTIVTTSSNHTLYAHLTPNTYLVSFDSNGGKEVSSNLTVTYNSNYGSLQTTTKDGYEFDGWYTEKDGGEQVTSTTVVKIIENQTLYAHWKVKKYQVCFDSNGGNEVESCKEVTYDSTYEDLPITEKEGYTFLGWFTLANDGTQILPTTVVTITENQTLYAHWSNNTYTVNFDANEGSSSILSKEVEYDSTYGTLPVPERTGYTFLGWYTEKIDGSQITDITKVTTASEHTLYAHWRLNVYTVSFNANGGEEITSTVTVTYGSEYGNLPTPSYAGHSFDGWYTEETNGNLITNESQVTITSNQTLYAHWTINTFKVTFNPGNGSVTSTSMEVVYGQNYGELPTAVLNGYTFIGWFTDTDYEVQITSSTVVNITQEQILFAKYEANNYRVNLNANGGSVTPEYVTETFDTNYSNLPIPSKTGYDFDGWYTEETGGEQISNTTKVTTASEHTLYAHWKVISSTLTISTSCGIIPTTNGWDVASDGKTATKNVEYDSTYGDIPTPTSCSGYTFSGWYTSINGGTQIVDTTKVTETSAHTLFAQWTPITFTVNFDSNGGDVVNTTITATYDSTYGDLPTPTKEGYTFLGWYTEKTDGEQISSTTKVSTTENQTLYAHWQVNTYTVTMSNINVTSSESTLSVDYGSSNSVTITPDEGYYISSVSCTNGYTTNVETGIDQFDSQTISIYNNSKDDNSICTVTANRITAESLTYTNSTYTNCTNVQCSIDELYEKIK